MTATIRFLGGAGTVTGSRFLLEIDGRRLLLDCGLFQGWKALRLRNREPLAVPPASLDAVVLTHAHLDHSGWLPVLARDGFRGQAHCTTGTRDLCRILLPDSGRLQEEEAEFANRHGFSRHHPALPLYTEQAARASLARLRAHRFGEPVDLGGGVSLRFSPAGHILGASIVTIESRGRRLVASGDLGRPDDPVMRPPARVEAADWLLVESTYGDRRHEPVDPADKLADTIRRAAERGGVVVVPVFAVGRAQTLLHLLRRLKDEDRIPSGLPVHLDSPMAVDATAIWRRHADEHRLTPAECEAACRVATLVDRPEASRALSASKGPRVILAASGMATGGRVLHHLKAFVGDARNAVLFSGFQAPGTRGAKMLAGAPFVRIHGVDWPVRARVDALDNLSAHADADEILGWLRGFARPPRRVFVVHGEPAAADALRWRIEHELGWAAEAAEPMREVALD